MATSINDLALRDEITDSIPSDLPEQGGGTALPVLLPGISIFRIPANVVQAVQTFDEQVKDALGNALVYPAGTTRAINGMITDLSGTTRAINGMITDLSGQAMVVQRLRVKFDKDIPLVVVGGPNDGQPVATSISTQPRNRTRQKGEPPVLVADMTYLIRESLQDKASPLTKPSEWLAAIQKTAGRTFRAEHGLNASCNPDRVRYIHDPSDASGRGAMLDPSGQHGCGNGGKRLYTSAFKLPANLGGGFSDIVYCPTCAAKLRGFFQIERFLAPLPGQQ